MFLQVQLPAPLLTLVRELEPLYTTMCSVLEQSPDFRTVPVMELATITVPTLKMLVLNVRVSIKYVCGLAMSFSSNDTVPLD